MPEKTLKKQQNPLLELRNVKISYVIRNGVFLKKHTSEIKAVNGVSLTVHRGESLGLVGESGSGKTTLGRAIVRLTDVISGEIIFDGEDITKINGNKLRNVRKRMGFVFQDPYNSLNPRMTVGDIIGEPLKVHNVHQNKSTYIDHIVDLMETVGLSATMINHHPHEFSGGQRQRVGIARALSAQPDFLILDEPVSALDVSIQAQIINLLQDLQEKYSLSYLFIAHDLSVIKQISHRVAVMYLGKIVETAPKEKIFDTPQHPYTQALISAVPVPDPELERKRERIILKGEVASHLSPPSGCVFSPRCPISTSDCDNAMPELRKTSPEHQTACIRIENRDE